MLVSGSQSSLIITVEDSNLALQVVAHGFNKFLVDDIGMSIPSIGFVELPSRVDSVEAVIAGLVKVNNTGGTFWRRTLRILGFTILRAYLVEIFGAVLGGVLFQQLYNIRGMIPYTFVNVDQLGIRIVNYGLFGLQIE